MSNITKYIICLFLIGFAYSCNKKSDEQAENTISINPEQAVQNEATSELFDTSDCKLIPLADTPVPISDVTRIQQNGNRLYVFDELGNALHVFNTTGEALFTINRQGHADGEYLHLADFYANKNNIFLLDLDSRKILVCDTLGQFVKKIPIDNFWANGLAAMDDALVLINERSETPNGAFHLFKIDDQGNEIEKFLPLERESSFSSSKPFSKNQGEILFCNAPNNTVYALSESGCKPIVNIDFGDLTIPEDYYSKDLRELMEEGIEPMYILGVDGIFGNDRYLVIRYRYKGDRYFTIYDRLSNKVIKSAKDGLAIDFAYQFGWSNFEMQDNFLYVISPADAFKLVVEYAYKDKEMDENCKNEMLALSERLDENSNPVLIRYKFK